MRGSNLRSQPDGVTQKWNGLLNYLVKQAPLPMGLLSKFPASIDRLKSEFGNRFKLVIQRLIFPNSKRNERVDTDKQLLMQRGQRAVVPSIFLFASGIIITFVGIGLTGYGIFKILDTNRLWESWWMPKVIRFQLRATRLCGVVWR